MNAPLLIVAILCTALTASAIANEGPKPPTDATKEANAAVLRELPFNNKQDFDDAQRGFIAPLPNKDTLI